MLEKDNVLVGTTPFKGINIYHSPINGYYYKSTLVELQPTFFDSFFKCQKAVQNDPRLNEYL